MADHAVKQILDAIETTLTVPALASVLPADVHRARVKSLNDNQLPALLIYLGEASTDLDENAGIAGGGLAEFWQQSVKVAIVVRDPESVTAENLLIQIRKEVEVALFDDTTLGIGVKVLMLRSSAEPVIDAETNQKALMMELDWLVIYRIKQGVPDVIIQ